MQAHRFLELSAPPQAKAGWQALAHQMLPKATGRRTALGLKQTAHLNAYQTFTSVNSILLNLGEPINTAAPDAPQTPPGLGYVEIDAVTLRPATLTGFRGQPLHLLATVTPQTAAAAPAGPPAPTRRAA